MQELIDRIASAAGIDAATAEKSVGMILSFLKSEAPAAEVGQLMQAIPGADAAAAKAAETHGQAAGGIMGLAGQLTSAGLGMAEMQAVGKELFAYGREKAGEDAVGAIAGSVPGLGQFA
jgi:hypothetical protein